MPTRDEETYAVLDGSLPIIRSVLVRYYGFLEEEAAAFEETLCVWFQRVVKRQSARSVSPTDLRAQLIFVACKYARAFQIAKLSTLPGTSEEYRPPLARPPDEVAFEVISRLPVTHP
jgi:hypothetical protein